MTKLIVTKEGESFHIVSESDESETYNSIFVDLNSSLGKTMTSLFSFLESGLLIRDTIFTELASLFNLEVLK